MWELSLPWWEFALRGAVVYLAVYALIRIVGKRQVGELTPFDLALLLLISEAVSNALRADDNSLTGAAIVVVTMLGLNWSVGVLGARFKRFDRIAEGRPQFLIRDGTVDYGLMKRESVSYNELLAALRADGCFSPHEAEYAVLETNGSISVKRKENGTHPGIDPNT